VRRTAVRTLLVFGVIGVLGLGSYALAGGGSKKVNGDLTGYEEVPALSTPGSGEFRARIDDRADEVQWTLSYSGLESLATQAHIHFGNVSVNGGISVFLCTNLGNGPTGTQPCPAGGGTISGVIRPADVSSVPAAQATLQGIAAGEFDELVAAIRAGSTYANVHTTGRPSGEIRAQLNARHGVGFGFGHDDHGEDDD
jgi:hypothetical protein